MLVNQQTNPKKMSKKMSGGGLTSPSFNSTWSDFVGVVLVVFEGLDLFGKIEAKPSFLKSKIFRYVFEMCWMLVKDCGI